MNKIDVVEKINAVLDSHCERPSAELRRLGEAMIKIADVLEDQPREKILDAFMGSGTTPVRGCQLDRKVTGIEIQILEARAIMQSVAVLLGISKA